MSSGGLAAEAEARRSPTDRTEPSRATLERAILETVAYADVFEYPLTADEIHRYLVGVSASRAVVRNLLNGADRPEHVVRNGRYFTLAGREAAVATRRARAASAAPSWQRAVRYGHA